MAAVQFSARMEEGLTEILESTVAVSRGLEALQCEHETVLEVLRDAADEDRDGGYE